MDEHTERRLSDALHVWAAWMERGRYGRGFPCSASGMAGHRAGITFDDLADDCDQLLAEATDAAIDDLEPLHRAAIATAMLRCRWTHAPVEYANSLAEAKARLAERLMRRGVL